MIPEPITTIAMAIGRAEPRIPMSPVEQAAKTTASMPPGLFEVQISATRAQAAMGVFERSPGCLTRRGRYGARNLGPLPLPPRQNSWLLRSDSADVLLLDSRLLRLSFTVQRTHLYTWAHRRRNQWPMIS